MWDPGFEYLRAEPALLHGYHRAFCVSSTRFRGTPKRPGLVLGLDRGGACRGVAFLVAAARIARVIERLWKREMSGRVYVPRLVTVEVESRRTRALAFVADRRRAGYVGRLELGLIAHTIATCSGARGPNLHYLENTLKHLEQLGIRERRLHKILQAVEALETKRRGRTASMEERLRRET
jgi:cation transport protein ChaC